MKGEIEKTLYIPIQLKRHFHLQLTPSLDHALLGRSQAPGLKFTLTSFEACFNEYPTI